MQKRRGIGAMRSGPAILAFGALAGCAHYEPKPLMPEHTLQALEARRLTDPELLGRIREKTGRAGAGISAAEPAAIHWDRAELLLAAMELNPGLAEARAQLEQATAS